MDKFSSVVGSNKKHIELFLTVLILLNFAPYEVLPGQMGNQVKSLMGPFLTPVQSLMSNVFVRALLFAVMVWSCCYHKDMNLFFILSIYFVISRR